MICELVTMITLTGAGWPSSSGPVTVFPAHIQYIQELDKATFIRLKGNASVTVAERREEITTRMCKK